MAPLRIAGADHPIKVREHPRARRASLKVVPPGRIEAVVPRGFGSRRLRQFVDQNRAWLVETLAQVAAQWQRQAVFPSQVQLDAVAENWEVEGVHGSRAVARERPDGRLLVEGHDEICRIHALRRWLARRARHHLEPWLERVSATTGLSFCHLTIRAQRTRWGSCSAAGRISLNAGLLFLQPHLVEYVLVHELCHTRHLDHSARFRALVARHLPAYREVEKELRRADCRIPVWFRYP